MASLIYCIGLPCGCIWMNGQKVSKYIIVYCMLEWVHVYFKFTPYDLMNWGFFFLTEA